MISTHRTRAVATTRTTSRVIAALALGAVALGSTTACTFITPQASTIHYSPSDGVAVPDTAGPVQVRNALIVADEAGTAGNFVAAIVNDTDTAQTLVIESTEADVRQTVSVPARTTLSLGGEDEPLLLEGIGATPGSDLAMFFQSGDGDGALVSVPVLDGALPQYADLVP
ncbi:hypothetical protein GCM10025738_15590 [Microbacterium fluvii]